MMLIRKQPRRAKLCVELTAALINALAETQA
jgi:hypothetical protein